MEPSISGKQGTTETSQIGRNCVHLEEEVMVCVPKEGRARHFGHGEKRDATRDPETDEEDTSFHLSKEMTRKGIDSQRRQ